MQKLELRSHFIDGALLVTHIDPGALEPVLRKTFAEADPNLTIISVRSMQQQVDMNFDQQRAVASLAGLFGIVALTSGGCWALRRHGLYGGSANQRVRCSHGAWSRPVKRRAACASRCVPQRGFGIVARHSPCYWRRAPGFRAAVWRCQLGPIRAFNRNGFARCVCFYRRYDSCRSGCLDRPDEGSANGVRMIICRIASVCRSRAIDPNRSRYLPQ